MRSANVRAEFHSANNASNPHVGRALSQESSLKICEAWDVPPAEPTTNEAVSSDIPTLILAGQLDPITPPSYGELAAQTLPNSTFLLFPNVGHGVSGNLCGMDIEVAFEPKVPGLRGTQKQFFDENLTFCSIPV